MARASGSGSDWTDLANARLIAAAPETAAERDYLKALNAEMLEVLQGFRRIGESDVPLAEMQSEIVELRNNALAAIAKAEGKHRLCGAEDPGAADGYFVLTEPSNKGD